MNLSIRWLDSLATFETYLTVYLIVCDNHRKNVEIYIAGFIDIHIHIWELRLLTNNEINEWEREKARERESQPEVK